MLYLVDGENINSILKFEQTGLKFNEDDFIVLFKSQYVSDMLYEQLKQRYKSEIFQFDIISEGNNSMDRQMEVALGVISTWDLDYMGYDEITLLSNDKEFANAKYIYEKLGLRVNFVGTVNKSEDIKNDDEVIEVLNSLKLNNPISLQSKLYNMIMDNLVPCEIDIVRNSGCISKTTHMFAHQFMMCKGDLEMLKSKMLRPESGYIKEKINIINAFIRGMNKGAII